MIKVLDVYNFIDKIAPFESQMDFDNSGLLIGDFDKKINKILLTLDITSEVVYEALKLNINLIISHHPVIFKPIKKINFDSVCYLLAKNSICAICAHTNLDLSQVGTNFCLFEKLNLKNKESLSFYKNYTLGLVGELESEMNSQEFALFAKKKLECTGIRFTCTNKKIKKVAVSSGAGGSLIYDAFNKKCDAFLTGEIKHSDILFANEHKISIFDVGHFKSENLVISHLKNILQKEFSMVEFVESKVFSDKIEFV